MAFYAYILRCSDGSYYVGPTDDIDYRLAQHQQGTPGGYRAKRRLVVLVWTDMFPSRDDAFSPNASSRAGAGPRKKR
jgi:putative endonuclease